MNLKEIDRVVGSIQSHLFRNSNSFSVGMLKSHFKGAGLQFKEHQIYNPGDDVRFIDWKLSAKTNTTFVKTFEEERNVEIYVFLDLSESMLYGFKGVSKAQAALEICCLLYLLADKSKDRISVILMNGETPLIMPLLSGHDGITNLISQLERRSIINTEGKIELAKYKAKEINEVKVLGHLKNLIARGKEVVFLSDLKNFERQDELQKLLVRKNMHCFSILSPIDEASTQPFSLFGKSKGRKLFSRIFLRDDPKEFKGRIKKIKVDDRYLERFVREML
ncbi:MAG: hypothetical protein CME65_09530 [Halobacteriovoraceae bacterium]|nr:hypothetical protein [Halobacteriovoraceae bacterium]|tara:strand:- start:14464 stop:15297 length:834 start_codon:yes stop_codon:yes gene_type:complete